MTTKRNFIHLNNPGATPLRCSSWAMSRLGYKESQRSAFYQFVHSNGVPIVRTGRKKIQFDEQQITDWLSRKSSTGKASQ